MGVQQEHIDGRLFVGTSGGDVITFVCLRDGTYGIARNGQIQQTWAADAMDVCLAAFHRMIDRRPSRTSHSSRHPTRMGPPPRVRSCPSRPTTPPTRPRACRATREVAITSDPHLRRHLAVPALVLGDELPEGGGPFGPPGQILARADPSAPDHLRAVRR